MEYNDLNIIKPVEGLDNITNISASRDRQEKKRRQQFRRQGRNIGQMQSEESNISKKAEPDNGTIDYTA